MGAVEHASHFGWEMTARKTLDVYDWALGKENNLEKFKILRNE
jgi:D-inositol-3-phosphate glycosyltransferase